MTTFQKIVCVFLALGLVIGGFGLYTFIRSIENLQVAIGGLSFENQGGPVSYFNEAGLLEVLEQQNAPFSNLTQELRVPDAETFQATLAVTAYPKEYTRNSTAQLVCGDQTVPMALSSGVFTGEIAVPLDSRWVEYAVLLETDGIIRSRFARAELWYFATGSDVFGWDTTGSSSYNAQHNLDIALKLDEALLPFADEAASARIYAKKIAAQNLDGKELFSEKMNGGVLQLNQAIPGTPGEEVMIYGEVLGKSGLTYVYPLCKVSFSHGMVQEDSYTGENLRIIGVNGQELELEAENRAEDEEELDMWY